MEHLEFVYLLWKLGDFLHLILTDKAVQHPKIYSCFH